MVNFWRTVDILAKPIAALAARRGICRSLIFFFSGVTDWYLQSLTDLGIPMNGSDGIFLQLANANGWTGDFAPMPEAW